jgi:hypothetical protein
MESLYSSSLRTWRGNDSIGSVMVASLAAATKGYDLSSSKSRFQKHVASSLSINPQATGNDTMPLLRCTEYENILRLNTASMILYLVSLSFYVYDVLVSPFYHPNIFLFA